MKQIMLKPYFPYLRTLVVLMVCLDLLTPIVSAVSDLTNTGLEEGKEWIKLNWTDVSSESGWEEYSDCVCSLNSTAWESHGDYMQINSSLPQNIYVDGWLNVTRLNMGNYTWDQKDNIGLLSGESQLNLSYNGAPIFRYDITNTFGGGFSSIDFDFEGDIYANTLRDTSVLSAPLVTGTDADFSDDVEANRFVVSLAGSSPLIIDRTETISIQYNNSGIDAGNCIDIYPEGSVRTVAFCDAQEPGQQPENFFFGYTNFSDDISIGDNISLSGGIKFTNNMVSTLLKLPDFTGLRKYYVFSYQDALVQDTGLYFDEPSTTLGFDILGDTKWYMTSGGDTLQQGSASFDGATLHKSGIHSQGNIINDGNLNSSSANISKISAGQITGNGDNIKDVYIPQLYSPMICDDGGGSADCSKYGKFVSWNNGGQYLDISANKLRTTNFTGDVVIEDSSLYCSDIIMKTGSALILNDEEDAGIFYDNGINYIDESNNIHNFYGNVTSDTDVCIDGGNCLSSVGGGTSFEPYDIYEFIDVDKLPTSIAPIQEYDNQVHGDTNHPVYRDATIIAIATAQRIAPVGCSPLDFCTISVYKIKNSTTRTDYIATNVTLSNGNYLNYNGRDYQDDGQSEWVSVNISYGERLEMRCDRGQGCSTDGSDYGFKVIAVPR